jgi:hypothetical protein
VGLTEKKLGKYGIDGSVICGDLGVEKKIYSGGAIVNGGKLV